MPKQAPIKPVKPCSANELVRVTLNPDTKSVQLDSETSRKCPRCNVELEHNKVHNCGAIAMTAPTKVHSNNVGVISNVSTAHLEVESEGVVEQLLRREWSEQERAAISKSLACSLCGCAGRTAERGRMLWAGLDTWVHTMCALWSPEVVEEQNALFFVQKAISRGKSLVSVPQAVVALCVLLRVTVEPCQCML